MVKRVIKLIVTGTMEKAALHHSLSKSFGTRNFVGEEVIWDTPRLEHGVTTHRLRSQDPLSRPMRTLARAMLAEAFVGKRPGVPPPDLVVVVDDVELANLGQEVLIVDSFKRAVVEELKCRSPDGVTPLPNEISGVRQRCSFHLLKPMIESYLIHDKGALTATGLPHACVPTIQHLTDAEAFRATDRDPAWLRTCEEQDKKMQANYPWWQSVLHPKMYLDHLLDRFGVNYQETRQGRDALLAANWGGLASVATDMPILSSLFADIWDFYAMHSPPGSFLGAPSPAHYIGMGKPVRGQLLRNV